MSLTATAVKQAKPKTKSFKISDGRGMYLQVMPNGSKYWRMKYRYLGREKTLALGVYPDVSLAEARRRREEARAMLANGTDPSEQKRITKLACFEEASNSFKSVSLEWFSKKMLDRSKSHRDRTIRALEKDIFPYIGSRPIAHLAAPDVLRVLRKIEARGAVETAHRAKQTMGQIFRYAVVTAKADRDPTADLKGALINPKKKHLASITNPTEVGKLLLAMDGYQGTLVVRTALLISPLLLCRPGELRHMEWNEINSQEERWEIPAEKMKIRQPHIVPLSRQALDLLMKIHSLTGRGKYVFPSARGASRPLSENGVRTALRSMGYTNQQMTPHGFRAMGRTLLDEELNYRLDWIEQQLAHTVRDANGRAYNRAAYLAQRKEMMQTWANYLDDLRAAASNSNVITASFQSKNFA
jgi:integrase